MENADFDRVIGGMETRSRLKENSHSHEDRGQELRYFIHGLEWVGPRLREATAEE